MMAPSIFASSDAQGVISEPSSAATQALPANNPTLFGAAMTAGLTSQEVEDPGGLPSTGTAIFNNSSRPGSRDTRFRAITLQHTTSPAFGIASCAYGDRCVWSGRDQTGGADVADRQAIKDAYHIYMSRGHGDSWSAGRRFYHASCISHKEKTERLFLDGVPFRLDAQSPDADWADPGARPWGFMIQKWYELKGMVSVEEVVRYIKAVEAFREAKRNAGRAWADWQAQNQNADIFSRKYPPPVFVQKKPKQSDFDFPSFPRVTLHQVLSHPYCEWVDIGY